jgi:hypothetical protein
MHPLLMIMFNDHPSTISHYGIVCFCKTEFAAAAAAAAARAC